MNNNKLETRNTSTEAESKEEGGKGRQAGRQAEEWKSGLCAVRGCGKILKGDAARAGKL